MQNRMFAKIKRFNPQNYHIFVEDMETGRTVELRTLFSIFQQLQRWGIGSLWEFDLYDDVVKTAVRREEVE
jgi:hypothetical protein